MIIKQGLKYSKEHEWIKVDGNNAYVGITDYAQHNLGEIVYVDLPEEGAKISAGDVLCAVDSVKAASDVYAPVGGKVVKVNETLADSPEKLNGEPYESWIALIEMDDASETDGLLDADDYEAFCASEG